MSSQFLMQPDIVLLNEDNDTKSNKNNLIMNMKNVIQFESLVDNMTTCSDNCCNILIKPYDYKHTSNDFRHKFKKNKAGIFFYNPISKKILLVQSRGMKWGPPKGTIEDADLTIEDCAIREVFEETGLLIDKKQLKPEFIYRIDRATYYYIELNEHSIGNIDSNDDNDASGITWINIDCLLKMVNRKTIDINSHCKKLLRKFFNIYIS
jgi:8-oxo-dGTP pyrophosphatase MutT (NUDIX family)